MWTAEEMGISYESEMMPFPPRFLHKEYMDVNILGTIPYLIDGEVEMTESVAMCQYLVDLYGPTDLKVSIDEPDYHHYLNWLAHSDATHTFPQNVVLRYTFQEVSVADKAAEGYRRWFVARLKLLEKSLDSREYLCSNRFTIADICVSYAIYLAKTLQIDEAFKPNITRWTDMLFAREGFQRSISKRYISPEGK
jgi:glutathione S-transferase